MTETHGSNIPSNWMTVLLSRYFPVTTVVTSPLRITILLNAF